MSNPSWPLSAACISREGYKEGVLSEAAIRSNQDSGPPKTRARFSAVVKTFEGQIEVLSSDDCDTIYDFHDDDCAQGAMPFDWVHPRTGESQTFKFAKRPAIIGTQGMMFIMSISLWVMP